MVETSETSPLVFELNRPLRVEWNPSQFEFNRERGTVKSLVQPAVQLPMNFHRGADDSEGLWVRLYDMHTGTQCNVGARQPGRNNPCKNAPTG